VERKGKAGQQVSQKARRSPTRKLEGRMIKQAKEKLKKKKEKESESSSRRRRKRRDKIECLEKLVEYDVSGIYIYYSKINDSEKIRIDFLLTIDRQNLTEFTIKKLINLKNNGN
jgi:hypothetical protein